MSLKKYRFFYHYHKQEGKMTVHFKGKCFLVEDIECRVPCETKWKPTQPRLVMQGFATSLDIENGKGVIK